MTYRVERAERTDTDLAEIFDFLVRAYQEFGDPLDEALDRAAARVLGIERAMEALAAAPHQGPLRSDLRPGLRSVTKDRAVFDFETDDERRRVRVLAAFSGGQDQQRAMLQRLLGSF